MELDGHLVHKVDIQRLPRMVTMVPPPAIIDAEIVDDDEAQ